MQSLSFISRSGLTVAVALIASLPACAQWTTLNNPFGSTTHLDTCVLLTNGDVMCHEYGSPNWHRRRPDNTGSYLNGTWDSPPVAPMPNGTDSSNVSGLTCTPCTYAPTYFASQVLPDGRVVVIGGEYNAQDGNTAVDTNIGFVYNPATDSWSTQLSEPFGTGNVGDDPSVILENGTMLIGGISGSTFASLNCSITTAGFTCGSNPPSFSNFIVNNSKNDGNDEEGYINLPGNKLLVVNANTANSSEIYDATTNTWQAPVPTAGIALTDLGSPTAGTGCNSHEVGPGVARQDGTIMYFSGSTFGQNAVYNINTGTWSNTAAMNFPTLSGAQYGAADAPASLLPDGHVLVMSSPVTCNQPKPGKFSIFNSPSHFFEWDGTNLTQVADSANAGSFDSYQGRMLLLPTGEVLLTAFNQNSTDAQQLYRNSNPQLTGYGPVITAFPPANLGLGTTYGIGGHNFNGFSLGAFYGDDSQSSTNYPLVRITDSAGHVFYAKTHGTDRMGVQAPSDNTTVTNTNFDVPGALATGAGSLVVVTNGFPSDPFPVNVQPATTLTFASGVNSADYSDAVTVSATLTATSGGAPISGETITFVLGSGGGTETCSATTNFAGIASCSITPNQIPGSYNLTATFAGDSSWGASSVSEAFTILKEDTAVAITGPLTSDYDDAVVVSAQLTDPTGGAPIAGKLLTFVLGAGTGTETCSATTGAGGSASCSITPNQAAGPYTLTVSFAGDAFYLASSGHATFTITREEDTIAFASGSPTVIANGHNGTLSAVLKEDGVTPIAGRTVTLTLGTGITGQSCTGTTDATGTAACSILVNQPLGPNTVTASFAGDSFYLPSSASEPVILFAFLAQGSMIVGNNDAATGDAVEFWGAQWAKSNSLTGGAAPDAFKGFASTAPQSCGGGWTSNPGNSSGPPATVPSYMGVIASSSVLQSGSNISGDVPIIIVVKTNGGYAPNPGHAGTGTVVAVFCH